MRKFGRVFAVLLFLALLAIPLAGAIAIWLTPTPRRRGLALRIERLYDEPAVACHPALMDRLDAAIARQGIQPLRLPSGAGHDAMAMAEITDVAMYFVRCKGGVSHHPDESVMVEDVALALDALTKTLLTLAANLNL